MNMPNPVLFNARGIVHDMRGRWRIGHPVTTVA